MSLARRDRERREHGVGERHEQRLRTLGRLRLDGTTFTRPKPLLLLAYLSLEGAKPRRSLSELFFGAAHDPRDALATTLTRLGRLGAGMLRIDGELVATPVVCDASLVLRALDVGHFEEACRSYAGTFLEAFDQTLSPVLEEWVFSTRENLTSRILDARMHLAEEAMLAGAQPKAAQHAAVALELLAVAEPEPPAIRRLYSLLVRVGHPQAARVRSLADRHGLPLDAKVGAVAASARLGPPPRNPLFGRDQELSTVAAALEADGARLVTVHGPGGVGKTHLALQLLHETGLVRAFGDARAFVPLESVHDRSLVPVVIAETIGVQVPPTADAWEVLATAIGRRPWLVVLDAWEHLTSSTEKLVELLDRVEALQVIVTSRERLSVPLERGITLRGLGVQAVDDESAGASPALQLFEDQARRQDLAFSLTGDRRRDALRLCRALDGLPLGLELAAAWTRSVSLAELADAVERDPARLADVGSGRGERHASLSAVVAQSWRRLNRKAQEIARRLSVFHGGFRRDAAAEVAGANIADLMTLIDRSWLTMRPDGRFEQHAVLRHYAGLELDLRPAEAADAHAAQARVLSRLVGAHAVRDGAASAELLSLLREEEGNLVSCLLRAAARRDGATLVVLAEPLLWYFPMMGRFREAEALFRRTSDALTEDDPALAEARAHLLASLAWCCRYSGSIDEAFRIAKAALAAAESSGSRIARIRALDTLGMVEVVRAENLLARDHLEEGLVLARAEGDPVRINRILEKLVYAYMGMARFSDAERVADEAQALVETSLVPKSVDAVATLVARCYLSLAQGQWAPAAVAADAGLSLARSIDYVGPQALLRGGLAMAQVSEGVRRADTELIATGVASAHAALPVARAQGGGVAETFAHMSLSRAALHDSQLVAAAKHVRDGLRVSWATGNRLTLLWSLPVMVDIHEALGDPGSAQSLAAALMRDPSTPQWLRDKLVERGYSVGAHTPEADIDALVRSMLDDA